MRKAQSAIEFFILIGLLLFIFLVFLGLFQFNLSKKTEERRNYAINDLALSVQNEISLATESIDGYQRQFEIPSTILGAEYEINITGMTVYIRTLDGKYASAIPAQNLTGDLIKGTNLIRKTNGTVYLNQ